VKRLCLLTIALALAFAPAAHAAPFTPDMRLAYNLAVAYWGEPHCTSVDMEIVPNGSIGTLRGEASIPAEPEPCFLYVIRELARPNYFALACAVEFHEVGHLTGHEHSSDPRSIMYPEVTFIPRPCNRTLIRVMNH
jgi:hypothetical protein